MNKNITSKIKISLPVIGLLITIITQGLIPNHRRHPETDFPYFIFLSLIFLVAYIIFLIISVFNKKLRSKVKKSAPLIFAVTLLLTVLNIITAKLALLPALLFPSFDNILSIFVEKRSLITKCVFYSTRLLFLGVICGIIVGFVTGVLLGFSKKINYWLNPLIKVIGPIPATAWIPLVLSIFPTTFGASAFIIALSVWFPVVLLTSSGIQNTSKVYFEVGKTLGTNTLSQILRIAIPGALPNIFQGIFFGVCSAFIALMTGEMFGARFGIGWYISMEKEMAEYKGVYAGLILIALFCNIVLALVFKLRGRMLKWQKGLVVW